MNIEHIQRLALAVFGFAVVVPVARADIFAGNIATGNGELFLNVWSDQGTAGNTADDLGYTRDLGLSLNTFVSSSTYSVVALKILPSFSPDARLTAFLNSLAAGANVYYNVLGFDSVGSNRLLTTVSTSGVPVLPVTTLNTITANAGSGIADINAQANSQNGTAAGNAINNSNTAVFSDTAYAGDKGSANAFGPNLGNLTSFNTAALLGHSANFLELYNASTLLGQGGDVNGNALVQQIYFTPQPSPVYWNLAADGTLSLNGPLDYTAPPAPEAETWAMFGLGLIAIGAVARRRLSV